MNCLHPELENEKDWPDLRDRCDQFTPSLECRKVLALERISEHTEDIAYLERLVDIRRALMEMCVAAGERQ
jgi:hypothetical protein